MTNGKRNAILVIDDEPANIVAIRHILGNDYTIYGVTDGMSGITAAKLQKPDLILLDIIMPEMDGYEVLTRLKSTNETRDIPVIIITKLSTDESEEKGLILGAEDYIQKPFSSVVVKLRVQNQLKVTNRDRIIQSQEQQQTLLKKISHSFIAGSDHPSLFTNALRTAGEFLDVSQVLLYSLDEDSASFSCNNEWAEPDLPTGSFIGDKLDINDAIVKTINDFSESNIETKCFHSNGQVFTGSEKDFINRNSFIIVPIFALGIMIALFIFLSEHDGREWSEDEKNLAVLIAGIFTKLFEREAMERQNPAE